MVPVIRVVREIPATPGKEVGAETANPVLVPAVSVVVVTQAPATVVVPVIPELRVMWERRAAHFAKHLMLGMGVPAVAVVVVVVGRLLALHFLAVSAVQEVVDFPRELPDQIQIAHRAVRAVRAEAPVRVQAVPVRQTLVLLPV